MRSCWIDKGNVPDTQKLAANQITRPVFDITDPQVNKDFLNKWRQPPFDSVGVYACANWNTAWQENPWTFAKYLSLTLTIVATGTGPGFPHVSLNVEREWVKSYPGGMPAYVTALLLRWRELRPTRETTLVLDGFQGGLWLGRPDDVLTVNQALLEAVEVEAFGGEVKLPDGTTGLEPFDPAGAVKDLTDYGFGRVVPCHDAKRLYRGWFGSSFTQGRLPA